MQRVIIGLFDLIFLSLICGLFYFAFIHAYPLLTPDEGRYAGIAQEMLQYHHWITPRQDNVIFLDKPVLVYWLEMLSMFLLGVNELAARLVPLCFGVIGIILTYCAGRVLYTRRTALVASLILMTSPLYFFEAHYVNMDLAVAVLISGALYCFIMAMNMERPLRRKICLWCAYIFAGLAILTKGLIGLAFPVMIIGLWILTLNRWRTIKKMALPSGIIIMLIIILPWYILIQKHNPGFFHYFFINQQFDRYVGNRFNMQNPLYYYPLVVFAGMLPWTGFILQTIGHTFKRLLSFKNAANEWFLSLWIIVILVFFSIPSSKISSYILPVFPPMALLIAHFFNTHWKTLLDKKSTRYTLYFFSLLIFAIIIASVVAQFKALPKTQGSYLFISSLDFFLLIAFIFAWRVKSLHQNFRSFFLYLLICSMLALLSLYSSLALYAPTFVDKKIAMVIKTHLRPNGKIVAYGYYNQDLPFYLQQPIYIALNDWDNPKYLHADNWKSEFVKGGLLESNPQQLINYKTLKNLWEQQNQVIVYLRQKDLHNFIKTISENYATLLTTPKFLVLTQPSRPAAQLTHDAHQDTLRSRQLPPPESTQSSQSVLTK